MKKTITLLLFFFAASTISIGQKMHQYSKTDLLVKFKSHISFDKDHCAERNSFQMPELDYLNSSLGLDEIMRTGNTRAKDTYCLRFKKEKNIQELIRKYRETDLFEIVEPNYIGEGHSVIPDDPFFFRQYGMLNNGTGMAIEDADIDMELAWDIEQGDESILVAVLDSGLKMDHPEFEGRLWNNEDEEEGSIDVDENGYAGDVQGWDFANSDSDPTDDHGHGTNVAGIMAATGNNSIGYAGMDWNCKVMTCKILGSDNFGLYSWWTEAIYYAVDNGAKVLNMSVGGSGYSAIMQLAVEYALLNGVTIVVSMGNNNDINPLYPAAYETTIAVGSTDDDDHRTAPFFWDEQSGSNYGAHIDVVAPGNFIYGLQYQSNTNYNTFWGGTSQAAPLVSGLSSLLLAQDPSRTPDEIREIIRNTAEDQVGSTIEDIEGYDIFYGYGRINAFDALNEISVSTEDSEQEGFIAVYPNPTNGRFVIEISDNINELQVYDTQGQSINRVTTLKNENTIYIDLQKYPSGVYIIQAIDTKNNSVFIEKVILQK